MVSFDSMDGIAFAEDALVQAVSGHAERQAELTARWLSSVGYCGKSLNVPAAFLMELAAVLQVQQWERQGKPQPCGRINGNQVCPQLHPPKTLFAHAALEQRLSEMAAANAAKTRLKSSSQAPAVELARVQQEIQLDTKNLARAQNDEQYQAISSQFDQLELREKSLAAQSAEVNSARAENTPVDVKAIVSSFNKLLALASESTNLALAGAPFSGLMRSFSLHFFRPL